ncbi:unnamed protein product [Timema podura]|uniref:Uncharacterized protein n=1 Tax=Timema podura TaxID=61482 RepID=A0ABN7NPZ2_TIMPD|nr:unnamed protein product [Timema podura]
MVTGTNECAAMNHITSSMGRESGKPFKKNQSRYTRLEFPSLLCPSTAVHSIERVTSPLGSQPVVQGTREDILRVAAMSYPENKSYQTRSMEILQTTLKHVEKAGNIRDLATTSAKGYSKDSDDSCADPLWEPIMNKNPTYYDNDDDDLQHSSKLNKGVPI